MPLRVGNGVLSVAVLSTPLILLGIFKKEFQFLLLQEFH